MSLTILAMNSKHICKFCKRSFPCGRSLGGHIRSHLIHKNNNSSEEPDLSNPRYELRENLKKTYTDSNLHSSSSPWSDESETEDGSNPNPRNQLRNPSRKSCFLRGNNSNSSVSEVVEPEQEEIATAMCLIMLSRDVGNWGDFSNNSNRKSQNLKSVAPGHLQNGSKMKEFEDLAHAFTSNDRNNQSYQPKRKIDDLDHKKKVETPASRHVRIGSKMKEFEVFEEEKINVNDHELGFNEIEMGSEIFKNNNKRSKFECSTCNKVFPSYQALGGHRASHKKVLGMKFSPVSKLESNEIISNGEDFLSPHKDHHHQQQEQEQITETGIGSSSSSQSPKKVVEKHECPICFRVFSSGQALGGHKRSHLLAANSNNNCEINLVDKSSSPEIRDFLDINLPPVPVPAEEDPNSLVGLIKPYLWVENSHNHEQFLGLIAN